MSTSSAWTDFAERLRGEVPFDLMTVLDVNRCEGLVQRSYTSDVASYPTGGVKKLLDSDWAKHVIASGKVFVSYTEEEFRAAFADHPLLESLGLHFALNIPILRNKEVTQTVNLLRGGAPFSAAEIQTVQMELARLRG